MCKAKLIFCLCLYFSGVILAIDNNTTSLQQNSILTKKQQHNSASDFLVNRPAITVCADKVTYDLDKNTLTYYGKAFVMQIYDEHILCHKPETQDKLVTYFTRNKKYSFKELQQQWFNQAKKLCLDKKECNFISGEKLIIQLDKYNKVKILTMESKAKELSQFYVYPTDINSNYDQSKKVTKGPFNGTAKKVVYDLLNKDFRLYGDATIIQNANKYKGDEIIYNLQSNLISIPENKDKRSKIVLDGVQDQTKIETGLTPISKYRKES